MRTVGIRELKNNLSEYVRRVGKGETIVVTAHGRPVARLCPTQPAPAGKPRSRLDELLAAGVVRPPLETGDPTAGWPIIRLPKGTTAAWIDEDRDER